MKTFTSIITAFGIVIAGVQWWQIAYRLHLFYGYYGRQPYDNHVDDAVFELIPIINLVVLAGCAIAAWKGSGVWRWLSSGVAAANVMAWLTFAHMHHTGMLVGYDEFIRHWKGR